MKVLVTGGAGNLGRAVCRALVNEGIEFLAVDKTPYNEPDFRVQEVDLSNAAACEPIMTGITVIVHLGNVPNIFHGTPQFVYSQNTAININVLEAAREAGIKRIVFASTIQAICGFRNDHSEESCPVVLPYLPMDSRMPLRAFNVYSLSKAAAEDLLEHYADVAGMTCIAIRFPLILEKEKHDELYEDNRFEKMQHAAFSFLPFDSAADLILCALKADVTGYRNYFVAAKENISRLDAQSAYRKYFEDIPLNCPLEDLDSLVDVAIVEKELGWKQPDSV